MKVNKFEKTPVSVIVPMRNSDTTILHTLESLNKQNYPISKIIIVDNVSSDNSVEVVEEYRRRNKKIPISLIRHKKNKGVGASYNEGARIAKSKLLIFMHSDSNLPTVNELSKLMIPMKDEKVIASYSTIILPAQVWETYNFWQKCLFARTVGTKNPGLNGKFDCIKKEIFISLGGFDDFNFGEDIGIGGEDADLHVKLKNKGKVVLSNARVIHLHYLGKKYSLYNWIKNRKLLARTYGRYLRIHSKNLTFGDSVFAIKPTLAVFPLLPGLHLIGSILLFFYSFLYLKKMFMIKSTLFDSRILLVPFINVFLVYYETFYMIESFLFIKKKV